MNKSGQTLIGKNMTSARSLTIKKSLRGTVAVAALLLGVAVLFFFSPSTMSFYPKCLFHETTGLYCPGCGSTRALYCLLHGELREALRANALAVLALPVLGFIVLRRCLRRRPPVSESRFRSIWIMAFLAVVLAFGILRNVPGWPRSWLTPRAGASSNAK